MLHPARDASHFLFAIARDVDPVPSWRNDQHRKTAIERRLLADLFDTGEHPMHALMKGSGQHRVGHDDVESLEAGNTSEQIPVGGSYTVGFEGVVGNGQHDVPAGPRGRLGHEACTKHVLVFAEPGRATLEVTERGYEESRLPHETLGSTIRGGTRLEHPSARRSKSSMLF